MKYKYMNKPAVSCWICGGKGQVKEGYGHNDYSWEKCEWCHGSGKIDYARYIVLQKLARTINTFDKKINKVGTKYKKMIKDIESKERKGLAKVWKERKEAMIKIRDNNPGIDVSRYSDYFRD